MSVTFKKRYRNGQYPQCSMSVNACSCCCSSCCVVRAGVVEIVLVATVSHLGASRGSFLRVDHRRSFVSFLCRYAINALMLKTMLRGLGRPLLASGSNTVCKTQAVESSIFRQVRLASVQKGMPFSFWTADAWTFLTVTHQLLRIAITDQRRNKRRKLIETGFLEYVA